MLPPSEPERHPAVPHLDLLMELKQHQRARWLQESAGSQHLLFVSDESLVLRAQEVDPPAAAIIATDTPMTTCLLLLTQKEPAQHVCTPDRSRCGETSHLLFPLTSNVPAPQVHKQQDMYVHPHLSHSLRNRASKPAHLRFVQENRVRTPTWRIAAVSAFILRRQQAKNLRQGRLLLASHV